MRFINNVDGKKILSRSLLEVGVKEAFRDSGFDKTKFLKRRG